MTTNIGYWKRVLQNPTPAYRELLHAEIAYLKAHVPTNAYLLDVGCGEGTTIETIQEITAHTVGIDNDPRAIEDASQRLASAPNTKIILADALNLPFNNGIFDIVIHMMTLVNFKEEKVPTLKEMSRVLKNTGRIIASVYSENDLNLRLTMYEQIRVPIEKIDGATIIFDDSVGANKSEQFSRRDVEVMARKAHLKIEHFQSVGNLAYIFTLSKT